MIRLIKGVWLACCFAVLAFSLFQIYVNDVEDATIVMVWSMVALSFPSGLLVGFLLGGLSYGLHRMGLDVTGDGGVAVSLALWMTFVAAGYFQWFIIVPKIRRAFNKRT